MDLIIAMLILGIIIVVHEFGHFLFAELDGMSIIGFSLGMGPRLFSFEEGGIRHSFKILPFGGSCMMLGEGEGITDESTFNNKSVQARVSVVVIGSVLNFILVFGLSMVLIDITGCDTTRLAEVVDGYPVQATGMEAGNVIGSIDDRKIHSYKDINWYLFIHLQKSLTVTWERTEEGGGTEHFSMELTPVFPTESNQCMIGVQFNPVSDMAENIGQLLIHSIYEVQYWIHYVFDTSYMMFHGMVSANDIGGPVGVVNAIDATVDEAVPHDTSAMVSALINLTILLSVDLGVMNPLPISALDNGRLVSLIAEAVRGKPVDKEKEGMVYMAGMMVFLAPMMLILLNDVWKLF